MYGDSIEMLEYRYQYVVSPLETVQEVLDGMGQGGWRVQSINRNPSAQVVDILFEKVKVKK